MLLPLGAGLAVNAWFGKVCGKMRAPLGRISTLSLAFLILLMLVTNFQNLVSLFGTRGFWRASFFYLSVLGLDGCWVVRGSGTKGVLALATAQRNIAAALVVGGKDFDPKVLVMIVVVAVVGLLVLMPLARVLGAGVRKVRLRTTGLHETGLGIPFLQFGYLRYSRQLHFLDSRESASQRRLPSGHECHQLWSDT